MTDARSTGEDGDAAALDSALAEIRGRWGVQLPLVTPVLRSLASGEARSVDRLVAESGLSHRSTTDLLRRLEPWLRTTDGRHALVRSARPAVLAVAAPGS